MSIKNELKHSCYNLSTVDLATVFMLGPLLHIHQWFTLHILTACTLGLLHQGYISIHGLHYQGYITTLSQLHLGKICIWSSSSMTHLVYKAYLINGILNTWSSSSMVLCILGLLH